MSAIGYIKGYLGLPYRPVNIDADAAAILTGATRAVKFILDHRAKLDRQGLKDTPLIVCAGERHSEVPHQVHHMLLASRLHQKEAISVTFESPHDPVASACVQYLSARGLKYMQSMDRNGYLSLKAGMSLCLYDHTAHSIFAYQSVVQKKGVPVCMIDASKDKGILNRHDPSTAKSIQACLPTHATDVKSVSDDGMWVRNHHMAGMAIDFARASRCRILIANCGNAHIAGSSGLKPERSLSAIFRQRGCSQIALPLGYALPKNHGLDADSFLECSDLPSVNAYYNPETGKPRLNFPSEIRSHKAEEGYLQSLMVRVGLSDDFISRAAKEEIEKAYRRELFILARMAKHATENNPFPPLTPAELQSQEPLAPR